MICIDGLNDFGDALNRRLGRSSHLVSDLPGEAGTAELVAFAKAGTAHEHFDVFEGRYPRAIAAGARVVTRSELVAIFRAKRTPAA